MEGTRGKGQLSLGMRKKHRMQFMPTPTVAKGSPTRILESGLAATLVDELHHIDE
ncbi:Hypothetical predicted protein, partial [Olea europaea subsp. europaea]